MKSIRYQETTHCKGEMAQQLKARASCADYLDSVPSTYKPTHNHLELQLQGIVCTLLDSLGTAHM